MDDVEVRPASVLRGILERIDGRGYRAYREIEGAWRIGPFVVEIERAQGDPFATPTRTRLLVDPPVAALPDAALTGVARRLGVAALLAGRFAETADAVSDRRGTGRSGLVRMEHPGQVVLPQTAVQVTDSGAVEARLGVGLPARGRRIAGREAIALLLDELPELARRSLLAGACGDDVIERHAATNEDAEALRSFLHAEGLVAFIADGAHLPRRSGVDDRPLAAEATVPFESPPSLRVEATLPNAGTVTGMGVGEGVTLIVGGGFHGKSTLLRAIQDGVFNHPPGDGRERVVARADAVKVRAEDGRSVAGVDISSFIDGLPLGRDTRMFSTVNASGSTSQAAAIVEAMEAGARVLLIDEDTSATNFMIRDRRMQSLVPAEGEPITPFVDRVRQLHDELGLSTVLVLGGSGDYLDVADRVVRMTDYRPADVSDAASAIARRLPTGRTSEARGALRETPTRRVDPATVDARRGRRRTDVKVPDDRTLVFGRATVDVAAVEQLSSRAQLRAIGYALAWAVDRAQGADPEDDRLALPALLDAVQETLDSEGLDAFTPWRFGDLAAFRRFELGAVLNRLRTLRVE